MEYVARLLISPNKKKFIKDGMNLVQSTSLQSPKIKFCYQGGLGCTDSLLLLHHPRWSWGSGHHWESWEDHQAFADYENSPDLQDGSTFCGTSKFGLHLASGIKSSHRSCLWCWLNPDTKVLHQLILTNISVLYVGVEGTGTDRDSCGDHDAHVFNLALCIWEWWSCPWGSHSLWTLNYLIFIIRLFSSKVWGFLDCIWWSLMTLTTVGFHLQPQARQDKGHKDQKNKRTT